MEPIAIVGSGCRFPGGVDSPSTLLALLQSPRDVSQDIPETRFNAAGYYHADGAHHGATNVRRAYLMEQDVRMFDASFFNISPNEADSMDPQQRMLLETVYEALESGGHTIRGLRGSNTAVYVGTMAVEYADSLARDLDSLPMYFGTGTNRAILANRISYFYDWHGPSMTIDTACSSSLVAVHQAVQALRTGDSRVAVACGSQVILGPEVFIYESKLKMLSPTGHSRMWDADADGYARGEGIAAVVLKRLSDAIADGDHIESLIRETGINQDGYSTGLTVPNSDAQAALIHQTYARAGLDPINNPSDRPQFFEAHGTGTRAGDPREAAAISACFGKQPGGGIDTNKCLYVGSVKTVIGHTEGTAGLAGLLKASGIIQNGFIPPNLLFDRLSPDVLPYYQGLKVPTCLMPWPEMPKGVPRRVSVNSFGFGGSNAHAILEEYRRPARTGNDKSIASSVPCTPFVFSAASEISLVAQLEAYSSHLKQNDDTNASDLAWTLQQRRSQFSVRVSLSATSISELVSKMDDKLAAVKQDPKQSVGIRSNTSTQGTKHLLGVFTGQGAQWAAMGAQLAISSEFVRSRIQHLQASLTTLPLPDRPRWRLLDEIIAEGEASRVFQAEISQPLCTALQIVLVDLLRTAGITFHAVVGHSSGEIAAAYAAGVISDHDAIRIAYYRGLHTNLAGRTHEDEIQRGAMLAVATSLDDAQDLICLAAFRGRLTIAAHNAPASVTLSGDYDAILHAKRVFDEEKKSTSLLRVDKAYHSHHMAPCGGPYVESLRKCDIRINQGQLNCPWYSSVYSESSSMNSRMELKDVYWRDNMANTVLFADAVQRAMTSDPRLTAALEIGPHPALRGPTIQNISEVRPTAAGVFPYSGVLCRSKDDLEAFSDSLGFLWSHLGAENVHLRAYEELIMSPHSPRHSLVIDLPSYRWNHNTPHWHESRRSRKMRQRKQPLHELLGAPCPNSTAKDLRWTNILRVSEVTWLDGHRLQGQIVFPAAGYVAMALEASKIRATQTGRSVELFELHSFSIPKAITFEEDDVNSGVETLVTLTAIAIDQNQSILTADFACYFCPATTTASGQDLELAAYGTIRVVFGTPHEEALSGIPLDHSNMSDFDPELFYSSLNTLGYHYSKSFKGLSSLKRRLNQSCALVDTYSQDTDDYSKYLVHPTTLDVAFQSCILAYSSPGDGRLWSIHVPTDFGRIRVNPKVCDSIPSSPSKVQACTVLPDDFQSMSANIDVFTEDGQHEMLQVEDLSFNAFAPATEANDKCLFWRTKLEVAEPDGAAVSQDLTPSAHEVQLSLACERLSYHYFRKWQLALTDDDWATAQPHFRHLRDFVSHTLSTAAQGEHPCLKMEWSKDSEEDITELLKRYGDNIDMKLLAASGENMPDAIRGKTTILSHLLADDMLNDFYEHGLGFARYNSALADMLGQVIHRYPHARILEIGAGTGGATKSILKGIEDTMCSYTYTDISAGFFNNAQEKFKAYSDRMTYKVLDIENEPASQGFEPHSYDIAIASNSLHATSSLQQTLQNARQLLKPGGYLLLLEVSNNGPTRFSNMMGGMPGWWLGAASDGRKLGPTISPDSWHAILRMAGFSGVDTMTPDADSVTWPFAVMAAQAVNDRVDFLRRPLQLSPSHSSIRLENVVIIGARSLEVARIAEEVADYLQPFCNNITVLKGLPTESDAIALYPMSTFVNLADIAFPIFKSIAAESMDGLKRLLDKATHVLWITVGALMSEPYHSASIGFCRAIRHEAPHISLNNLDIAQKDMHLKRDLAKVVAEHLLRQSALDEWQDSEDNTQLWSKEPEMFFDNGRLQVPRLRPSAFENHRLNSTKRVVTTLVPVSTSKLSISLFAPVYGLPCLEEQTHAMSVTLSKSPVRVQSSSLLALNAAPDAFFFLGIGRDTVTDEIVVALSATNSNLVTPIVSTVLSSQTLQITGGTAAVDPSVDAASVLIGVSCELMAMSLILQLSHGSRILIRCSAQDRLLALAVSREATAKGICVTFACDDSDGIPSTEGHNLACIKINHRSPRHVIRKMLLSIRPTHFLDITNSQNSPNALDDLGLIISRTLPDDCQRIDSSSLFKSNASMLQSCCWDNLEARLKNAVSNTCTLPLGSYRDPELIIPLDHIHESTTRRFSTSIVQWPHDGYVKVQIRSLEVRDLFSSDKTYLLVGMSGQVGQSLCEWMIKHGAGHVCLTSRRPRVNESWLQSFGGAVKVFAMDVTDKSNLVRVVAEIRDTCPPIMGIVNGAMVLHDKLFSNMSAVGMQEVLGPKIDGSNNLDQLFHDTELDFFVLLSSLASVVGNSGQSNYAAANSYLGGLARQRRKRGLAASTLDIGRITGIGYIETVGNVVADQLTRFGFLPISEPEFHQMFAEAIQTGYPDPEQDTNGVPHAVLTTGIQTVYDNSEDQISYNPWISNPFFSYCVVRTKKKSDPNVKKNGNLLNASVSEQLSMASTENEAMDTLQAHFICKIRTVLQISPSDEVHPDSPLIELGIDSFAAVEIRSWFLKELKVDIPVLKVVGGASMAQICQLVLEKLPGTVVKWSESSPMLQETPLAHLAAVSLDVTTGPIEDEQSISTYNNNPISTSTDCNYLSERSITPLSELSIRSFSPIESTQISAHPRFVKTREISFGQSRFWFLRLLLDDPTTFNVTFFYQVSGNLRIADLERAVQAVAARHEALRTCFVPDKDQADRAFQKVTTAGDFPLRLEQKKVASFQEAADEYDIFKSYVFDLSKGDTMRLLLLTLSPSLNYLLVNFHHMVMDGVSFHIFLSDLEKAYIGEPFLNPAPTQFPDFSLAQKQAFEKGDMASDLQYWQQIFPVGEDLPVLPLLSMSCINSRVPITNYEVNQLACRLDLGLSSRIKSFARKCRCTPFHVHLAAFKVMLFRFMDLIKNPETQHKELIIGIADASRHEEDVMHSIGFFLNLLALRFQRHPGQTFSEAVVEARKVTHAALENSRLPFDVLLKKLNVARSSSYSTFFQAFFDYRQGGQEKHAWGNCQFEVQKWHPGRTAYDITLDIAEGTDTLVTFRTQMGIYDETATNLLLKTYVQILETLVEDGSLPLVNTPLFGKKQILESIEVGRGPNQPSGWPETISHRIDQVAHDNQENVAIMDGNGNALTYSEMINRIGAIAEALSDAKIGHGSRVLVFQQAASDWVCSMLAIMRIGAIYVPLDLRSPLPRLAIVAADCSPSAVLADDSTMDLVERLGVPTMSAIDVSRVGPRPSAETPICSKAGSAAAIVYTSGSTGKPKGIVVTHEGLRNEIEGYTRMWKLDMQCVLQQSAFTFNHSLDQIFTGLVNGGMVYVVPGDKRGDPLAITKIIYQHAITYTKATPSEYLLWLEYGGDALRKSCEWRFAFAGGEPLTSAVMREFVQLGLPNLRVFNSYGPTEVSISSAKIEVNYREKDYAKNLALMENNPRSLCGYSLPNYTTYIVDDQLRPLPAGMPGEVCIGGAGVTLGYLNNTELTKKHFIDNPFASPEYLSNGWRFMYRTGDIGHMREDGAMVFHNRMEGSTQVKIRGIRIELGDIESNIVAASGSILQQAIVTLRGRSDAAFLVAHVVFAPVKQHPQSQPQEDDNAREVMDKEEFLIRLLHKLPVPQYMLPVAAIPIDRFPLSNHSKIDRRAVENMPLPTRELNRGLANLSQNGEDATDYDELTETMLQLGRLWNEILENTSSLASAQDLLPTSDFFLVGGNSISAIRLQERIRQDFQVSIRLVDLFGASTLVEMGRKIQDSVSVELIDWDDETAVPLIPSFLNNANASGPEVDNRNSQIKEGGNNRVILVTGAFGYLTSHIVSKLAANPHVAKIHCVAIRGSRYPALTASPKFAYYRGDLASPLLGLSEEDFLHLSLQVDIILHFGATSSFWDSYYVLRPSNVHPTRELVKMAARRRIPIHYISTTGAIPLLYNEMRSESRIKIKDDRAPSLDGSNGYVATRWASERILKRSATDLGIPAYVYRFLPRLQGDGYEDGAAKTKVMNELVRFIDVSGKIPDMDGWEGQLHMMHIDHMAQHIYESISSSDDFTRHFDNAGRNNDEADTSVIEHECSISIDLAEVRAYIRQQRGDRGLSVMPVVKWIGLIKKLGFNYVFASYQAHVQRQAASSSGKEEMKVMLYR